jgi:hydrogenase large subunit
LTLVTIRPATRVEGHLKVEATIDRVGGEFRVTGARVAGTMFRGFERLLLGRDPRDAAVLTQRICGVCPISHGVASSLSLEAAIGQRPPANGRLARNLVLAANFLQSHILHFYHLAALDYVDTTGVLERGPWVPRPIADDLLRGPVASTLVDHYVQALEQRRTAHRMAALLGGRLPCSPTLVAGGSTEQVTAEKVEEFGTLLDGIRRFVENVYLPDVELLASHFPAWSSLGRGVGNLLAFGCFDQDGDGTSLFLPRGRITGDAEGGVSPSDVKEDTDPSYSRVAAPRYDGEPHEVGPLARMWVRGDWRRGISVMDRHLARAVEARLLAEAMGTWLRELRPGAPAFFHLPTPDRAEGVGLVEAPRGALGHWLELRNGLVAGYRIVTPTAWNASPRDSQGRPGPMEQALVGLTVRDPAQPIELMRVVHSFDPCLSCAVHVLRPDASGGSVVVHA